MKDYKFKITLSFNNVDEALKIERSITESEDKDNRVRLYLIYSYLRSKWGSEFNQNAKRFCSRSLPSINQLLTIGDNYPDILEECGWRRSYLLHRAVNKNADVKLSTLKKDVKLLSIKEFQKKYLPSEERTISFSMKKILQMIKKAEMYQLKKVLEEVKIEILGRGGVLEEELKGITQAQKPEIKAAKEISTVKVDKVLV